MKICVTCKINKNLEDFAIRKDSKDGLRGQCRDCQNPNYLINQAKFRNKHREEINFKKREQRKSDPVAARARDKEKRLANPETVKKAKEKYRRNNPEKQKEYDKKRYWSNPEKEKARSKIDKIKNAERVKKTKKQYNQANPGKCNSWTAQRHAAKLNATPKWLTKNHLTQIEEIYILAKELQWLADPLDPLEVDHIVPLQGEEVSGLHVPWNLQILPKSLNCSKHNKLQEE